MHPYKIFEITPEQVECMCANMFCLVGKDVKYTIIMSGNAHRGFRKEQFDLLKEHYQILVANVDLIEQIGGGSCRCMLVEKF